MFARFVFPNGLCALQSDDTRCLSFYFALDSDFQQPQKALTGIFVTTEANVTPVVIRVGQCGKRLSRYAEVFMPRGRLTGTSAGAGFDPSRRGGHKNSENAATFSEFLGQEKNLDSALTYNTRLLARIEGGKRYERGLEQ